MRAAYRLRKSKHRTVRDMQPTFAYCTTRTDFEVANTAYDALLGAATDPERDLLIMAARPGPDDEDVDRVTSTEMRPSSPRVCIGGDRA